jgi:hypothetical protein
MSYILLMQTIKPDKTLFGNDFGEPSRKSATGKMCINYVGDIRLATLLARERTRWINYRQSWPLGEISKEPLHLHHKIWGNLNE